MFSGTTLIITGITYIVLICLAAVWYFLSLGFSFAGASQHLRKIFTIIIAVSMIFALIAGVVVITVRTKSSSLLGIIGYLILTVGVLVIICASVTIWKSTLGVRQNLVYQKVTEKGELILDYYYNLSTDDKVVFNEKYYYMNNKMYYIRKADEKIDFITLSPLTILNHIDTSYYIELYEKNNKFTLLYNDGYVSTKYPECFMYLKDVGWLEFNGLRNILRSEHTFDSLGLTVLNEKIHAEFVEKWKY